MMKTVFTFSLLFFVLFSIHAQTYFGEQDTISVSADEARCVYADDLDGDGDIDVVSVSTADDKVAWYENTDGQGTFTEHIISSSFNGVAAVSIADINGDNIPDVIATAGGAAYGDQIIWYDNTNGDGTLFTANVVLNADFNREHWSVFTGDFDGDGDIDILTPNTYQDKISWYQNTNGLGAFSGENIITTLANNPYSIYAADIDTNGYLDVLSASYLDDKIAWYPNVGGGTFSGQNVLTSSADAAGAVYAADVDGDGDQDILYSAGGGTIPPFAWFENTDGQGTFSTANVISYDPDPGAIQAADFDSDGDLDLAVGYHSSNRIVWFENTNGSGAFSFAGTVTSVVNDPSGLFVADINGDNKPDIVSSSYGDDKIAWYENKTLIITEQPFSQMVCPNDNIMLTVSANTGSYTWQVDEGAGFYDLSNNVVYSGVDNDTLYITNVTAGMNGFSYRCVFPNAGSFNTDTAYISVGDTTDPVLNVQNFTIQLDSSGNATLLLSDVLISATDNCLLSDTSITQTAFDCTSINNPDTISVTLTDAAANSTVEQIIITVSDTLDPAINCITDQVIDLAQGQSDYTVQGTEFDPVSTDDNCGVAGILNDYNSSTTLANETLPIGTTTITWTVADNAGNTQDCSFDVTVNVFVGVESIKGDNISVYPNPSTGKFIIKGNNLKQVKIMDLLGRTIHEKKINSDIFEVDLSKHPKAIYHITVETKNDTFYGKLILE